MSNKKVLEFKDKEPNTSKYILKTIDTRAKENDGYNDV